MAERLGAGLQNQSGGFDFRWGLDHQDNDERQEMKAVMRYGALAGAGLGLALLSACGSATTITSGKEEIVSAPLTPAQLASGGPVTWNLAFTGPVSTTSRFTTAGVPEKGQRRTFVTKAGNLVVTITRVPVNEGNGSTPVVLDKAACRYGGIADVDFRIDGALSTGKWKGASGTAEVAVLHGFTLPKVKASGTRMTCDLSPKAQPTAPSGSFNGTITLKTYVPNAA
jgi:hypothetical protein